jgi:DNA-binding transcriptional LysR family regulator
VIHAAGELGVEWRLTISEFLEIPYVVANTDMLGFVPRTLARRAMRDLGLRAINLPLSDLPVPVYLIWHETRRTDDGHRWLRDLVAATVVGEIGE